MSRKRVSLEKKSAKPLHDQIYEAVRNDLLAGMYKTGQKMPTTPKLLVRYKVNSSTLQRAMNRLVKEGYIERSPRRGTFVKHKPQGARVAVLVEENLLAPSAEFGRLMVSQLKESAISFGWSLEIFDGVGQQAPGHAKNIADAFRNEYQQHPFRGLIELNTNGKGKGIVTDADNLYHVGLGPNCGSEAIELDLADMAGAVMGALAKQKVKTVYSIRGKSGIPFGPKEKAALKKEAKAAGLTLKLIELSSKDIAAGVTPAAFFQAKLALKTSKAGTGFLCSEVAVAQGIAEAVGGQASSPASILVSASASAPTHLAPFTVYHFASSGIAEALLNRLDEKMHANGIEDPKPVKGKLIPASKADKAPSEKDLKKAWKA